MQALDLYRAIMTAAAIAPTADQAQWTARAIENAKGKTYTVQAAAWTHWDGLASGSAAEYVRDAAHAEAMGELIETASRDLARKHATFAHAAGRVKMINTRERLQGFATDMLKGAAWALWGGGDKPAELIKPRKARTATTWRAGLVKVAAEALQDGQSADFLAIAMEQLGGRAYMHTVGKPFIAYAPDYAEGLPEGFAVARKCSGEWVTMHMETGFSAGRSARVKAHALESGREEIATAGPEKLASALARARGLEAHHAEAIDAWRAGYGLEAAPVAQDVPEAAPVAQVVPEAAPVAQDVPEAAPVAQDVPEAAPVAQDVPEAAPVAQDDGQHARAWLAPKVAEAAPVAQAPGMVPRDWIAAAALDLERITWTWAYDAARRMNIEAGRLGVPGALRYIRETLQRIATQGTGLEKTEAIKALQSLAQAQAHDVATLKAAEPEAQHGAQLQAEEQQAAATVATLVTIARASATSAQHIEAQAPEVVAMAADGERGQIQRTGDTFADYWANSASASIERDIKAGRARVVQLGARPGAADVGAQAHTPHGAGAGAGGPDTPTPPAAPDYSHPVETRAQAHDYSGPVETQGQPGKSASDQAAEVPRIDPEECERQALMLEAINLHGEALQWRCWAAGAPDLAERVGAINRQHERLGTLTPELEFKRQAISAELRARKATPPTDPDPDAPLHSPTQDTEQQPMTPTNPMTGAELQTLREACGLTRERLGELCNVAARTVKHWETRAGAAVPADVAGLVLPMAQLVHVMAERNRQRLQAILQKEGTTVHLLGEKTPRNIDPRDTPGPVLIRYHEAADMTQADRLAGLLPEVHGAIVTRVVLDLMGEGFTPRVVWFDPAAYTAWATLQGQGPDQDTPDTRGAWAAEAIKAAIPHPGDQPPPAHTPAR